MDWMNLCTKNYNYGYFTADVLKVYVVKSKITPEQYQEITGQEYLTPETMNNK